MHRARRFSTLALAAAAAGACGVDNSGEVRGRGLTVAALPPETQANVYEAATQAAFDVDDPGLSLLLDARRLPRTVGLAPAGRLDGAVATTLEAARTIRGTCEPALNRRGTAQCKAKLPGYVLRFSPIFSLGRDSTQLYLYAQKYDTPSSGISQSLRFERAYQVVRRGSTWRAVLEGRVPNAVRGEAR